MPKADRDPTESPPMLVLRRFAMRLPEAEEGTSCVNRAFRARGKAFAYLGMKADRYKLMVKLTASIPRAEALQKRRPDSYSVGKHGWTTVWLRHTEKAPKGLLEGWIEESYRVLAHPQLVELLPPRKKR